MSDNLIRSIENSSLNEYEKRKLIEKSIENQIPSTVDATQLEIEKYKIDKLVENNLLEAKPNTEFRTEKLIEYGYNILKDARFYYTLLAVLIFVSVIYNSSQYWKYETKVLDYREGK